MLINELIKNLEAIRKVYGNIAITGGYMTDDRPLSEVSVTDIHGMEVWPADPTGVRDMSDIDGVFLQ